jgi:hypothetical protein
MPPLHPPAPRPLPNPFLALLLLLLPHSAYSRGDAISSTTCTLVRVETCSGLEAAALVNGDYVPYSGACSGAVAGKPVYWDEYDDTYLYYMSYGEWTVGAICGSNSGIGAGAAYSSAVPYEGSPATWQCSNGSGGWVPKPASVTCARFGAPCPGGEFGNNGECEACPADTPYSPEGELPPPLPPARAKRARQELAAAAHQRSPSFVLVKRAGEAERPNKLLLLCSSSCARFAAAAHQ